MIALWSASALLAGLAWIARDPAGTWLIPAVIGPLALQPLTLLPGDGAIALLAVLWPVSALSLALALAERRSLRTFAVGATVTAVLLGLVPLVGWRGDPQQLSVVRYLVVIAIVAVPVAARIARPVDELTAGRINEQSRFVATGVVPAVSGLVLVTSWDVGVAALITTLIVVGAGSWIAVRPLTWLASRTAAQRDLAVAASEAERSRLAADLHDGPLQNVLLLARRLDDSGDLEGAALARDIGLELRELSGDLRLPLLDDLGVGPAIEWLAGRVRRMTAADVQVAIASEGRVPPPVELAAFRIAQEAIANAVRHGSPPIFVRCRTATDALSLSVEDAGRDRTRTAEADQTVPSRLGLLNMQQRAEQVGAHLEWRQPDSGGTLVALEWHASPA
jgi:signal transduction histidine kinase